MYDFKELISEVKDFIHELDAPHPEQTRAVIKEDLYWPILGLFVGGTVASAGFIGTVSSLRRGEGLKARDSIGVIGGLIVISSFKQADKLTEQMMYQEVSNG